MAAVTVVIPTYNRAELLRRAIDSVFAQTFSDFELFIADNASSDGTQEFVASIGDPRVYSSRVEQNIGPSANFTRSLYLGDAPYVTMLQDDDLMLPDNLARKVALLDEWPSIAVAHAAFCYVDENDDVVKQYATWTHTRADIIEPGDLFVRRCLGAGARINFSSAVMRRTCILGERWDPADGRPSDLGAFMRIARRGDVGYIDTPLTAIRRHAGSDTVQAGTMVLGEEGGYRPDFEVVRAVQAVKERFLADYAADFDDLAALRRASRRWARRNLTDVVRRKATADPSPARVGALLLDAARIEPTVLASREVVRLAIDLAGTITSRKLRARADGLSRPQGRSRGAERRKLEAGRRNGT
ncbi:MAG: glycosyl transferase family 2 [Actinomycetia bacterium]|nr:glycosyl transferase family 2 [Actinomycetes bacterium]